MTANASECTRCDALRHLTDEQAGHIQRLEAEVRRLREKLAATAMAVHSDPDPM